MTQPRVLDDGVKMSAEPKLIQSANGTRSWCLNGKRHRVDGPAYEWADGYRGWCLNDEQLEFGDYVNRIFPEDSQEKILFILQWSGK